MRLLSGRQVAEMLGYSPRYLMEKLSFKPGFPKPVRLTENGRRRWKDEDILNWMKK